ncbi:RsmB/NOP family class I SAM-dependent RNA methyltransferase [Ferrovibrio sp.]|uniref:RsmB/NOP family class I SAM-dependent RNA methyltransferase n=1 Tax=Ferrovibrio sp. TaxID=1917215 RepID=UPI0025B81252|nr:RsmB/NOP family class I SAM-dependent RNA methyltransferase [Ferrovibrio sp.]MBX3456329.1 RsmB/NOP family class I SAM-dependent RNA methyltransferase [Ferrovibrio sp.]
MRPQARLAAAMEILGAVLGSNRAADRLLASWQRNNRYAGAKDRRAVSEMVYAGLRQQGVRRWRLEAAGLELTPRHFMLADPDLTPEQAAALCDGSNHAPPPLDEAERAALAAMPPADQAPLWAKVNLPPELCDLAAEQFGDSLEAELAALNGRAPLDLRVNSLKAKRADILEQLAAEGIAAVPTPYSPLGIRLEKQVRLESHPLYTDGLIEPQDEAAQLAGLLLGARPGETVIDLCAGAGGKTLLLGAQMRNKGRLIAADRDGRRLDRLKPRLGRAGLNGAGLDIVETCGPDKLPALLEAMEGQADRVLLDVPCSGSGTWRRNPESRWRFGPEALDDLRAAQADLLRQGARLLRPGGILLYATCSIFGFENDQPVDAFLADHPDVRPVPLAQAWGAALSTDCPFSDDRLRLSPLRHGTDGFFAAVMQRQA